MDRQDDFSPEVGDSEAVDADRFELGRLKHPDLQQTKLHLQKDVLKCMAGLGYHFEEDLDLGHLRISYVVRRAISEAANDAFEEGKREGFEALVQYREIAAEVIAEFIVVRVREWQKETFASSVQCSGMSPKKWHKRARTRK